MECFLHVSSPLGPIQKSMGIQERCQLGLREGADRDWPEVPQVERVGFRLPPTLEILILYGEAVSDL